MRIKRLLPLLLALMMAAGVMAGCERRDPAEDIGLQWTDDLLSSESQEPIVDDEELPPIIELDALEPHPAPVANTQKVLEFKGQNPDAVGWLYLPDTTINEIVMQDPDSNDTYLRATPLKEYDINGCYFADYESRIAGDADQISPNIVIYGHSMSDDPNGEDFCQLKKLLDKDFAQQHPYIFFSSATQDYVYEIFSIMYASAHDETGFYYIDCALGGTAEEIAANAGMDLPTLVAEAKAGSLFAYPSTPEEGDKILTLSTCTYKFGGEANRDQRFVVFGRLLTAQDDMPETILLEENLSPKMPAF